MRRAATLSGPSVEVLVELRVLLHRPGSISISSILGLPRHRRRDEQGQREH
jgi:hypothetical protein